MMDSFDEFARQVRADNLILYGLYTDVSRRVDEGAREFARMGESVGELHQGVGELHKGMGELHQGVGELHKGMGELHKGMGDLHKGVSELHKGVGGLHASVGGLHKSVGGLHETVGRLEENARQTGDLMRQVVGHSRHSNERMDTILTAMHSEFARARDLDDLRRRVEALERKQAS